jgi:hypothetical protein
VLDRREGILARLGDLAAEILGGEVHVYRNRLDIAETRRPAVVINDGDEAWEEPPNRTRPPDQTYFVEMVPQTVFAVDGASTADNGGSLLNTMRREFIRGVLTDQAMRDLVSTNGQIRVESVETDLARGRKMEGEMLVSFVFRYPLMTNEL